MDMWMNLDQIPTGKSMYTLAVTSAPEDTPRDEVYYDEVDVVASSRARVSDVISAALEEIKRDYPDCRVIGVSNQSDGYVMYEDLAGYPLEDLETYTFKEQT